MENKQILRKHYKDRRNALTPAARADADKAIFRFATTLSSYQNASVIMAYHAIGSEVSTDAILRHALAQSKTVLLPVTNPHTQTMYAAYFTAECSLVRGGYGILEPQKARPYEGVIDLIFVPGLVFHVNGHRIGYGKGYYDKFFETHSTAVKVGLAYTCQISAANFSEAHDVRMDYLVTEQGGIICGD